MKSWEREKIDLKELMTAVENEFPDVAAHLHSYSVYFAFPKNMNISVWQSRGGSFPRINVTFAKTEIHREAVVYIIAMIEVIQRRKHANHAGR